MSPDSLTQTIFPEPYTAGLPQSGAIIGRSSGLRNRRDCNSSFSSAPLPCSEAELPRSHTFPEDAGRQAAGGNGFTRSTRCTLLRETSQENFTR